MTGVPWCDPCKSYHDKPENRMHHKMLQCKAPLEEESVCDFCSAKPVVTMFPCPDFEALAGISMSHGGWAACEACARLVHKRDLNGTVARALAGIDADFREEARAMLLEMHGRFFRGTASLS